MIYTFDMLDVTGRIDHVQLHQCDTSSEAVCLARAALFRSFKAVAIEIWQETTQVARISSTDGPTVA